MGIKFKNTENKTREKIMVENLKDIKEIFDKYNIKFWLNQGTLLGAIREGKIIRWDRDVDLGMMAEDFERNSLAFLEIKEKGFFLNEPLFSVFKMFTLNFFRFGYNVGINPYSILDKDTLVALHPNLTSKNPIVHSLWFLYRLLESNGRATVPANKFRFIAAVFIKHFVSLLPLRLKKIIAKKLIKTLTENNFFVPRWEIVPRNYFEKFKTIKFYDMEFRIPFNAEEYLEYKYGPDWKTPKREWNWTKEDRAVVKPLADKENK
jgi:hypothetical protein